MVEFSGLLEKTAWIMSPMLEKIRRNRHLGSVILALFAMVWLTALLAGAVRLPNQAAFLAMQRDICTTAAPTASINKQQPGTSKPAATTAYDDFPHSGHHGPHCLLCMTLSLPPQVSVQLYKTPVPIQGQVWLAPAYFPPSLQATAPLPPRGPPLTFDI